MQFKHRFLFPQTFFGSPFPSRQTPPASAAPHRVRPAPRVAPLPAEAIGNCTSPSATSRARNEGGFPLSHPTFFMGPTATEGPLRPSPRPAPAAESESCHRIWVDLGSASPPSPCQQGGRAAARQMGWRGGGPTGQPLISPPPNELLNALWSSSRAENPFSSPSCFKFSMRRGYRCHKHPKSSDCCPDPQHRSRHVGPPARAASQQFACCFPTPAGWLPLPPLFQQGKEQKEM